MLLQNGVGKVHAPAEIYKVLVVLEAWMKLDVNGQSAWCLFPALAGCEQPGPNSFNVPFQILLSWETGGSVQLQRQSSSNIKVLNEASI